MARAHGSIAQAALAFESTYGTAPGSGFTKMPFATTNIGAEQGLVDSELVGYGRDPLAPIQDVTNVEGDIAVPIDARFFGMWLKLLLGEPTTTGTDPYTHVWDTGATSLPSAALEIGHPAVPSYEMIAGLMVDQMQIQMARSGNLAAGLRCVGQSGALATSSAAGTLATLALARFGHFSGYVKREGSALASVTAADLTIANGLDRVETIRADGLIDGADPGMVAVTGQLQTRFDSTTLLTQAIAGSACSLEFGWSSGDHSLKIEVHEVYLPRPKREISGPRGIMANFDWQAALNASAGCAATVTLVNDVESY